MINGVLLYYFSILEISLLQICERLPLLITNGEPFSEFRNKHPKLSNLNQMAGYINYKSHINIKINPIWQNIKDFQTVRNIIIHSPIVPLNKLNTIKSITNRNKGMIIFDKYSHSIKIKIDYLENVINSAYFFLESVISEIWNLDKCEFNKKSNELK